MITPNLGAILADGQDFDLCDDCWLSGTILSRSGLEWGTAGAELACKVGDLISDGSWNAVCVDEILGRKHWAAENPDFSGPSVRSIHLEAWMREYWYTFPFLDENGETKPFPRYQ